MIRQFLEEIGGINLVDIGSSGDLDRRWDPLRPYINLVGFDPNGEECARMTQLPHNFKSVQYIPSAIAGSSGKSKLYKTNSIFCYSLLKPNTPWLRRFSFSDLFEVVGESFVDTETLANIPAVIQMDVDVIKTDTQGLELPVLKGAGNALERAFLVETETGFVENYVGETTYAQVDEFMRSRGFLLFDINTSHRIPRNNKLKAFQTGAEQLLWCEAVWLRDYVALADQGTITKKNLSREKLLKALVLCSLQRCTDYGFEIATVGRDLGLLSSTEMANLETPEAWQLGVSVERGKPLFNRIVNAALRLLPTRLRQTVRDEAATAARQRHLFRF